MILWALIAGVFASPGGVHSVAEIHRFSLSEPMRFHWAEGAPTMDKGTILVVEVDADMAKPTQAVGSTLFVGATPAAVTHPGYRDGFMVVFVPGHPNIGTTPVFWAQADRLPERTSLQHGTKLSENAPGIAHRPARTLGPVLLQNERMLYGRIAELITQYAPADADFAHGYRLAADQ